MDSSKQETDCWADWLIRGRHRGLDDRQLRAQARTLLRLRNRVLRGARLRPGSRLLDVGAGTGMLALEARRRAGPHGAVAALDISRDALRECRRLATPDSSQAPLHAIVADACHLPFADASFEAAVVRSVLIYVEDKRAVVAEIHRVLRPGGRLSLFEPINSAAAENAWCFGMDMTPLQPAHGRIVDYLLQSHWEHRDPMLGFDERDLARLFIEQGFRRVRLAYEYGYGRRRLTKRQVTAFLTVRPNPTMLSYEEAAREVLGEGASEHLARVAKYVASQQAIEIAAVAYITARR